MECSTNKWQEYIRQQQHHGLEIKTKLDGNVRIICNMTDLKSNE